MSDTNPSIVTQSMIDDINANAAQISDTPAPTPVPTPTPTPAPASADALDTLRSRVAALETQLGVVEDAWRKRVEDLEDKIDEWASHHAFIGKLLADAKRFL